MVQQNGTAGAATSSGVFDCVAFCGGGGNSKEISLTGQPTTDLYGYTLYLPNNPGNNSVRNADLTLSSAAEPVTPKPFGTTIPDSIPVTCPSAGRFWPSGRLGRERRDQYLLFESKFRIGQRHRRRHLLHAQPRLRPRCHLLPCIRPVSTARPSSHGDRSSMWSVSTSTMSIWPGSDRARSYPWHLATLKCSISMVARMNTVRPTLLSLGLSRKHVQRRRCWCEAFPGSRYHSQATPWNARA